MTRIVLTPSMAESYERCPWMTYLENVCELPPSAVFENVLGSACHVFIAGIHKPRIYKENVPKKLNIRFTIRKIDKFWPKFWTHWLKRVRVRELHGEILKSFESEGMTLGPLYIKRYLSFKRAMTIMPDKFEFVFPPTHIPGTSVELNARVDQIRPGIHGGDVLLDLKFSSRNDLDPHSNFALRCYSLLYWLHYGQREEAVAIWNVPFGVKGIKSAIFTMKDLEHTVNKLRLIALDINARKWNVPGRTCFSCTSKEMCSRPASFVDLIALARRNSHYIGPLPTSRSLIISERVLEPQPGKNYLVENQQGLLFKNEDEL